MKKILFLISIFPLFAQEFLINSFNDISDYDDQYWVSDQTGDS